MPEYIITLTEAEVNAVLAALAQQPYYAVAELIGKIREIRENLMIRNPAAKKQLELVRKAEKLFMQGQIVTVNQETGGTC